MNRFEEINLKVRKDFALKTLYELMSAYAPKQKENSVKGITTTKADKI